jgi:hypothetical protein
MTVFLWPEHGDDGEPAASVVTSDDYVEIILSASQLASFWVSGRVVDESQTPLANRVVSARQGRSNPSGLVDSRSGPPAATHERGVNTTASTDSTGRFRIGRFGPGLVTIFAWGPDETYCPIANARLGGDVDLGTLQLTAPVAVEVTAASGSATAIEVFHGGYFIEGRFELKAGESWDLRLGKGDYTLRWKVDGAPRETSASVGTGAGTTKIRLL